ncbi:Swt1 family HEPN domain-containing protein [Ornithinimicrobium sp. W1679]|uniref:Swt1 family HEPN domain-containing protein n=1 Tax=Ornithinimicrobium sp. W1679 TaxID=3418770 RepID=UPI003CE9A9BA
MATSNRERIGHMLNALSPALRDFISRTIDPELAEGQSWVSLVAARDLKKGIEGKEYSEDDPQVQLRMLTENIPHQVKPGWYPFDGVLSRVHQSYASELRDVRNDWAHHKSFSDDDAYRALDTAERLLSAIGAGEAAADVGRIRTNLRRVTADREDKRTLRQVVSESPLSTGLRPWREVLPPHMDVATGNFKASEFAADLYKVATEQESGRDYSDPVEFFRRTYLTEGLRELIGRAVDRLTGDDNASPVINLQTNFGGGKTHSMLSLWHLAGGTSTGDYPQEVQELLGEHGFEQLDGRRVNRVAIVGNHFAPTGETKPDGTFVRTIWGELAWQLGGAEGYAIVADADQASTPPGRALHELLAAYSPAVILIDEWVAYARSLYGVASADDRVTGGTFDNQFGFAQSLTEAAKGTNGIVLAISIPASETGVAGTDPDAPSGHLEEVGGSHGMEALTRLQNVVRRVAEPWRPASSTEAYHIVRQRLFTTPDAEALAAIGATARAYVDMYRKNPGDFPREVRDTAYEDRIKHTYPIHPELFDRLYEDWSSLERFQRTRGVLRLMNAVVHALWVGEDAGPLIMPGSMPLAVSSVNSEIAQYLQDSWKSVIDADVDGPQSEPAKIDKERPQFGGRSLTKRLARTVFFGAVPTIGSAHKGIDVQRVFLGTAVPGDRTGDFHAALNALADRATYYYSGQGKHWYDLQANITRSAKDQAERLHREDVWAEIIRRLQSQSGARGAFARVHICPESDADVPDTDEVGLVVLHPRVAHESRRQGEPSSPAVDAARHTLEKRGTANRTHRNMLVFLAPDKNRLEELERAVRDYLGWSYVLSSPDLDLTDNQKAQANDKKSRADETVNLRLAGTYQWALHPKQPDPRQPWFMAESKIEGTKPLAERVSERLEKDGDLARQHAMTTARMAMNRVPSIWESGHLSVGELWGLYTAYPYMPRLTSRSVLIDGLTQSTTLTWERDGVALAERHDEDRYVGLWLPGETPVPRPSDQWLVVKPELAIGQRENEKPVPDLPGPQPGPLPPRPGPDDPSPLEAKLTRYFASAGLDAVRYTLDFKQIADEVLTHLARPGRSLKVRVEIEAEDPNGFDDATVRTVKENAVVLRFDQSGFEER